MTILASRWWTPAEVCRQRTRRSGRRCCSTGSGLLDSSRRLPIALDPGEQSSVRGGQLAVPPGSASRGTARGCRRTSRTRGGRPTRRHGVRRAASRRGGSPRPDDPVAVEVELLGDAAARGGRALAAAAVPADLEGGVAPVPVAEQLARPVGHAASAATARPASGSRSRGRRAARASAAEKPVVALVSATTPTLPRRGRRGARPGSPASSRCARRAAPRRTAAGGRRARSRLPGGTGCRISVRVRSASTSGWPCERNAAKRREVVDRAPQLAGRRHRAGVVQCGSGVSVPARWCTLSPGRTAPRVVRRARHPERVEDPLLHQRRPVLAPQPGHRLAEQPEAEVAVVVVLRRRRSTRAGAVVGREQVLDGAARRALPPRPDGLALHPRRRAPAASAAARSP